MCKGGQEQRAEGIALHPQQLAKHRLGKQHFGWFIVRLGEDVKAGICSVGELQDCEETGTPAVDTAAGQADHQRDIKTAGG